MTPTKKAIYISQLTDERTVSQATDSLISMKTKEIMKVNGSKIIFSLGVSSSIATAVIVLYFSIR